MRRASAWVLLCCGVTLAARAGEREETAEAASPRTVVWVQPLRFFYAPAIPLGVDHAFSERVAGSVDVELRAYGTDRGSAGSGSGLSAQVSPGLKWFFTGRAPEGLWAGPEVSLRATRGRTSGGLGQLFPTQRFTFAEDEREWAVGARAMLGYSLRAGEHLSVQAGVGLGLDRVWCRALSPVVGTTGSAWVSDDRLEWSAHTRLAFGYAF